MLIKRALFATIRKVCRRTFIPKQDNLAVIMLGCFIVVGCQNAFSQRHTGTIVVIGYSKNKIVVAADSRVNDEGKGYIDTSCKIMALSNNFLFSASGRISDVTGGRRGWDGDIQAKEAFSFASQQPIISAPSSTFAEDVTDIWAQSVSDRISNHIRITELMDQKPLQFYLEGSFVGLGPRGDIQAGHATIRRANGEAMPFWMGIQKDANPPNFIFIEDPAPILTSQIDYRVLGGPFNEMLVDEIILGVSPRAKKEQAITRQLSKGWPRKDFDALMAMRLVQLVVKYDNHPEWVGGPIDVVELDKGGTIRWIQRKDNCKDN